MEKETLIEIDKPKKEITLEKWRKKAKKMNVKYENLQQLSDDACKKIGNSYHYISNVPIVKMLIIYPFGVIEYGKDDERIHLSRDALFYVMIEKGYKKLNTEKLINELVIKLAPAVNTEELVRDALYDTNPDDLKELYERVIVKEGKVRDKPGCYKLVVGGKRGTPFELMLRD